MCPVVNAEMIGNSDGVLYNLGQFNKLSKVYLYLNIETLMDDGW